LSIDLGLEERFHRYSFTGKTFRQIDPSDPNPDFHDTINPDFETVPVDDRFNTNYTAGWIMFNFRAGGFEFKPGVRSDRFSMTGQQVIDPRATMSYAFSTGTTLSAGAGLHHKLPDMRWLSPTSGNPNLRMERSEHYAAGIEQKYRDWIFKVEGFRHYYSDIAVVDPYITRPWRLNQDYINRMSDPVQYIDTEILRPNAARNNDIILFNQPLYYSNDGTGFSEGYEIYIKKAKAPAKKGWYGWISYTWSRSLFNDHQHIITEEEELTVYTADERRIINLYDNTKDGYADFDRTHIINIVYGYKINANWLFGARWKYQTSTPYTEIIGVEKITYNRDPWNPENDRPVFDPKYSPFKNTKRLKPYHRLDIRIDRFINYTWGYGNVFFEALNLYVRKNETASAWDSSRPYSLNNPTAQTGSDLTPLVIPAGKQNLLIPFFNIGIEIKF
ncbi:MAG: TonB-dependent receptor, partial [Spirochaetia bacterium]|nr:TonB-dependent receptor [Spirochaetia bacterium]